MGLFDPIKTGEWGIAVCTSIEQIPLRCPAVAVGKWRVVLASNEEWVSAMDRKLISGPYGMGFPFLRSEVMCFDPIYMGM